MGGGDVGCGTAASAVAVVDSVVKDASGAFGAVDARVGGDNVAAAGIDIGSRSGSGSSGSGTETGYVSPRAAEPQKRAPHSGQGSARLFPSTLDSHTHTTHMHVLNLYDYIFFSIR